MLIEPARRTDDGATLLLRPDGAEPAQVRILLPEGVRIDDTADPAVPAALLPAMRRREALRCEQGVSERLRYAVSQFQSILTSWDRELHGARTRFSKVAVDAPERRAEEGRGDQRGTACFFTAGADSLHSVITNLDRLDALIYVSGYGTPPPNTQLGRMVQERVREAAALLGLPLLELSADLQTYSAGWGVSWDEYHGSALATIALLLSPQFSRVLIPATNAYTELTPLGSHPLLDPLWSTERVEIVHDGADATRIDKLRTAASHPAGRAHLQVCWQHLNDRYNCGVCEKCVRTGVAVRLAGLEGAFPDLPVPSARQVARSRLKGRGTAWKNLDALGRESDQRYLSWAIRVARARHKIQRTRQLLTRR